jgi:hypothetical protein
MVVQINSAYFEKQYYYYYQLLKTMVYVKMDINLLEKYYEYL